MDSINTATLQIPVTNYEKHQYYSIYFKYLSVLTKTVSLLFVEDYLKLHIPTYNIQTLNNLIKLTRVHSVKSEVTILDLKQDEQLMTLFKNKPAVFLNLLYYRLLKKSHVPSRYHLNFNKVSEYILKSQINRVGIVEDQKLIVLKGLVKIVSSSFPTLRYGVYICTNCKKITVSTNNYFEISKPRCINRCKYSELILDEENSLFIDIKKIEIQELQQNLIAGQQPRLLTCIIPTDLATSILPGKQSVFTGLLQKYIPDPKKPYSVPYLEIYQTDSTSKLHKKEFLKQQIKNFEEFGKTNDVLKVFSDLLFKRLHMAEYITKALILQLVGGSIRYNANGTRSERSDIHILLVGDPGTGKSELLKIMNNFIQGTHASGVTSSGPGLTAAVVKDSLISGRWGVEVGAFVFADKTLLTLDELDKVKPVDIASIHEAMQQQTISIAKAGIMMCLNSRCSVLAAANPQFGKFLDQVPIEKQLTVPNTILNRFDLIFFLKDPHDVDSDDYLVRTILNRNPINEVQYVFYRDYIIYVRSLQTSITKLAQQKIREVYQKLRAKSKLLVSARQLQAIIRLAEASAKLRCSNYVTIQDVNLVEHVLSYSLESNDEMTNLKQMGLSQKNQKLQ